MTTDPRLPAQAHDTAYKSIFAHRRAVADTLSGVAGKLARRLDLSSLEKLPASFVTKHFKQRHADMLWRVRTKGGDWLYLIVLLEFQSTVERSMALRMHDYTLRVLQGLDRDARGPRGEYPPVLPVVVYNGKRPWTAARDMRDLFGPVPDELVGYLPRHRYLLVSVRELDPGSLPSESVLAMVAQLEQAWTPEALNELVASVARRLERIGEPELFQAFDAWVSHALARRLGSEGEEYARSLMQEKGEMGMTTLAERMERMTMQRLQERHEQGIERGIERGRIEGERALAHRIVARRFGPEAGKRLLPLLEELVDTDSIEAVVDAVLEGATTEEILARVRRAGVSV